MPKTAIMKKDSKYVTRTQAVKDLQIGLPIFRKLCILKGVVPREPKRTVNGKQCYYYRTKDIMLLKHDEPLMQKLRHV